jgi:hypothetical protein
LRVSGAVFFSQGGAFTSIIVIVLHARQAENLSGQWKLVVSEVFQKALFLKHSHTREK